MTVGCDENCGALETKEIMKIKDKDKLIEELWKALEHWENHGYLYGCSHGQ